MRQILLLVALCTAALLPKQGAAQSFPVEIDHIYGSARIEARPERVVSLSFIGHDFLLSLGVVPVALRKWYGPHAFGVWPWAQEALGSGTPVVMQGEIDIEAIAALEPDLIVGQWSGMTRREYALLSQIAPTVAPAPGAGDYSISWQQMLLRLGEATGHATTAQSIIARLDQRLADLRAAHPEWQGATGIMVWAGTTGAYTGHDIRGKFLGDLGFVIPPAIQQRSSLDLAYFKVPDEDLSPIDADVLIWLDSGASVDRLNRLPLRRFMRANLEGREIYSDLMLSAALSHSSPLSISYALDRLVPLLEQAMDGDPATEVTSSRTAGILTGGPADDS
ncbi:ABC transporter substrate-binding protein [Epibacterium sp. Ofav1-8]|uniref:ABC transporter substrate-binding protein n=1 Tax=Epibacterium sp. Ofav1-8 TaxID=2917735 RepID=UPI001EF47223|nr:ABC transporter substrate-binding protein [Epibacterium sp. Ofav1-8]MCG7621808.1 ABC transporter substrate-binding protein [Epibacterium sp. Ofav1-8]